MPHSKDSGDPPRLQFSRSWSAPGKKFNTEEIVAQVLADPTFEDLLECVAEYGMEEVRAVCTKMLRNCELQSGAASVARRSLRNIEIGYLRAKEN